MKTKLSLLFLLLSTLDVFAQTKPRLVLFTDYASCYYGLKDPNGKQIRKAGSAEEPFPDLTRSHPVLLA